MESKKVKLEIIMTIILTVAFVGLLIFAYKEDSKTYEDEGVHQITITPIEDNGEGENNQEKTNEMEKSNPIDTDGNIEIISEQEKKSPRFGWIDDDGKVYVYDYLYPWAVENKVPFTSALITQHIESGKKGWMSVKQVLEMYNNHPEIVSYASHTRDHVNATNMLEADMLNQICGSKNDLVLWGGINCELMVYPNGQVNDAILEIVSKNYKYGFQASGPDGAAGTRINYEPLNEPYKLMRRKIGQTSDIELIKKEIDITIENNGLLIFMSHVASKDAGNTDIELEFAVYDAIVAYIREKGYDIEPVEEICDLFK